MVTVVCLCEWLLLCVEKVTVMVCAIWGSSEMCQIHGSKGKHKAGDGVGMGDKGVGGQGRKVHLD